MNNKLQTTNNNGGIVSVKSDLAGEMVFDLMAFHPEIRAIMRDKNKGGEVAAKMIAMRYIQLSLATGASPIPFTNEMHILPGGKVDLGINYYERMAQEQGGVNWVNKPRPLTDDEKAMYGLSKADTGCMGTAVKRSDMPKVRELIDFGATFREAMEANGVTAIGVVRASEPHTEKKGRTVFWLAEKRFKKALFRQLFPFIPGQTSPGAGLTIDNDTGNVVIDQSASEWKLVEAQSKSDMVAENGRFPAVVGNGGQIEINYEEVLKMPMFDEIETVNDIVNLLKNDGVAVTSKNALDVLSTYANMSADDVVHADIVTHLKQKQQEQNEKFNQMIMGV